jgi:hypothetical protein
MINHSSANHAMLTGVAGTHACRTQIQLQHHLIDFADKKRPTGVYKNHSKGCQPCELSGIKRIN